MNVPPGSRRRFLRSTWACMLAGLAAKAGMQSAWAETPAAAGRMTTGEPSLTAMAAALQRAVHQVVDHPRILDDRYAIPILGPLRRDALQRAADARSRSLRASIVMRSRYAEDCLAQAVSERAVRQYVVLGAGLDTFAYRNPHAEIGLRVFEVDHPATQRFKRARLAQAGIPVPAGVTFVPVDFETQTLSDVLAANGFDFREPAVFSMLGVVIYLTDHAVMDTLRMIAACSRGSAVVFSFSLPDELLTEEQRSSRARTMARLETLGEPWLTFYAPATLAGRMREVGFSSAQVFDPDAANRTYFAGRADGLRVRTAHMMAALV